jgi:tetratricopeptide (TPR) repeat protein
MDRRACIWIQSLGGWRAILSLSALSFAQMAAPAGSSSAASSLSAAACEDRWLQISASSLGAAGGEYARLVADWRDIAPACKGTGVYEARLAIALAMADNFVDGKATLASVKVTDKTYAYLPELAALVIELMEGAQTADRDRGNPRALIPVRTKLQRYVQKYPSVAEGFGLLGNTQTLTDQHAEAVKSLARALTLSRNKQDKFGIYRNLTISYSELGQYEQAFNAAGEAYELNAAVTSDEYFVYAFAKAQAGLGRFVQAQTTIKSLVAKNSEVTASPDFKRTVEFILAKQKAAGVTGQKSTK